jgi:hypothetical protein
MRARVPAAPDYGARRLVPADAMAIKELEADEALPQAAHSFSGFTFGFLLLERGSRGPRQMSPESLERGTTPVHRCPMSRARKPQMLWGLARSPLRRFRNQRRAALRRRCRPPRFSMS